jgi:hypothetical protein
VTAAAGYFVGLQRELFPKAEPCIDSQISAGTGLALMAGEQLPDGVNQRLRHGHHGVGFALGKGLGRIPPRW